MLMHNLSLTRFVTERKSDDHSKKIAFANFLACAFANSSGMEEKVKTYKKAKSAGLCVIAGCCWGTMGLFVRTYNGIGLDSFEIVALRAWVTVIIMFAGIMLFCRENLKIHIKDLWCFIGSGLFSITFFNWCYFTTISDVSLSTAAVLLYTAPFFVMLMSAVLFHESLGKRKIVTILMAVAGCALVSLSSDTTVSMSPKQLLIGLGAGFGYALYSIFGRYALDKGYSSLTITFYTFLFSSIGILPFVTVTNVVRAGSSSPAILIFTLVFGLVSTVIPYLTYTTGLQGLDNSTASVMTTVEPVMATFLGIIVFSEKPVLVQAGGIILILSAVVICNLPDRAHKQAKVQSSGQST